MDWNKTTIVRGMIVILIVMLTSALVFAKDRVTRVPDVLQHEYVSRARAYQFDTLTLGTPLLQASCSDSDNTSSIDNWYTPVGGMLPVLAMEESFTTGGAANDASGAYDDYCKSTSVLYEQRCVGGAVQKTAVLCAHIDPEFVCLEDEHARAYCGVHEYTQQEHDRHSIVQLTTNHDSTCALRSNGQTQCVGSFIPADDFGSLAGTSNAVAAALTPQVVPDFANMQSISLSNDTLCGIDDNSRLRCVQSDDSSAMPLGGTAVSVVDGGGEAWCAVDATHKVRCWGGAYGSNVQTIANTNDAIDLSVSATYACSIHADGDARCWSHVVPNKQVDVSLQNTLQKVAVGNGVACFIASSGQLSCRDLSSQGIAAVSKSYPMLGSVNAVEIGESHICANTNNGEAYCWSTSANALSASLIGSSDEIMTNTPSVPVALSSAVESISSASMHACALTDDGRSYCWGNNFGNALGQGGTTESSVPVLMKF